MPRHAWLAATALMLAACGTTALDTDVAAPTAEPADSRPELEPNGPAADGPEADLAATWAADIMTYLRHDAPQTVIDFNNRAGVSGLAVDWNDDPQEQLWTLLAGGTLVGTPPLDLLTSADPGSGYHEVMVVLLGHDRALATDVISWGIHAHDGPARHVVQRRWEQLQAEPSPRDEFDSWWDLHADTSEQIADAFDPMRLLLYTDWELEPHELDEALAGGDALAATAAELLHSWEQTDVTDDYRDAYDTVLTALALYVELGETVGVCRDHPSDACTSWAQQARSADEMLADTYAG